MARKPEPPPLSTWNVFRVAHKAILLGTVEARDKKAAIEAGAKEFKTDAWRLYAVPAATTGPRITPERRRMLKLLARSRHGVGEGPLLHSYGFGRPTIVGLVSAGLVTAEHEVVKAGGKPIEVVRVRITEAGRKMIEG
jgi:hypothetical protein